MTLRESFAAALSGEGVEIGPLHNPFPLPRSAHAVYADKFDYEKLCEHNADVDPATIVRPAYVCDTHTLDGIDDHSLDFLVASHVVEHLHNPVKALQTWCRVVKPGAPIVCVVPDARYTFDLGRPLTSFDHLLWDYENDGTELKTLSDLFHIAECNLNMHEHLTPETALELAQAIQRDTYDTHFHVWTHDTFGEHLATLIRDHGLPLRVLRSACDGQIESLFLLETLGRKRGLLRR
jgi:SAM-dependent methyltransferase